MTQRYRVTLTFDLSLLGGSSEDASTFLAETLRKRLAVPRIRGTYLPGEVIANTVERLVQDEVGDHHTIACMHMNTLLAEAKRTLS